MAEHCAYCGDWLDDESNYVEIDGDWFCPECAEVYDDPEPDEDIQAGSCHYCGAAWGPSFVSEGNRWYCQECYDEHCDEDCDYDDFDDDYWYDDDDEQPYSKEKKGRLVGPVVACLIFAVATGISLGNESYIFAAICYVMHVISAVVVEFIKRYTK